MRNYAIIETMETIIYLHFFESYFKGMPGFDHKIDELSDLHGHSILFIS